MADYTLSARITGDASGFQKAFSAAERTLSTFESNFKNVGSKITSIGDSLTSKISKPALTAATALAAIPAVKGFDRLVGIDTARSKLQALGHDAESVESIMNSALKSVEGTAFGLDEAATVAANAVAAGVKPGKDLAKYLTMTADAAAIAGISMSEMGSIINKVQTGQTVYTEDLEQLADRGLPVYQWLAEEAGVAASEVKQLASDGQISSQMLYNAINDNIGGAAKIMGETSFTAAIDNIGASIGRIGANFLDAGGKGGGFFSQLKPLMAEFNESLGGLETKATDLGVKFGAAFASTVEKVRQLKAQFEALPEPVQGIITKVAGIGAAVAVGIGPALKIIGPLVSGFGSLVGVVGKLPMLFGAMASPIGLVVTAIAALAAGFVYLMQTNEGFRNVVMGIIQTIAPSLQALFTTMASLALQLAPVLKEITLTIGQLFASLAPLIAQLVGSLAPVIATIINTLSNVVQAIMPAVISVLNIVTSLIQSLSPVITNILSVVVSVMSSIISAISPIISFIGGIISTIMSIISPIITFIANVIASIIQAISPIVQTISGIFSTVFTIISGIWNKISITISTVINKIASVISTVSSTVSSVFNKVYSVISSVMGKVRSFITKVFGKIKSSWSGLTSFVSGVFSGIGSAVSKLVSTVKGFVNGVISGINAAIGLINMIPGVNIGKIPYLAHGTDNWQGGFAVMNEGGRGELTYLPNGSQVIPHDISVKYAKESARANATAEPIDLSGFMEGMVIQVINNTSVDGTPLRETMSDYVIKKIGNQQKAVMRAGGVYV